MNSNAKFQAQIQSMRAQIEEMHAETEAFSKQFNAWAVEQNQQKSQSKIVRICSSLWNALVSLRDFILTKVTKA
ncbi:MAG: hypothetical protein F6K11_12970 [Leptolyngbya sp. SIO3F4]|nr:hypothetical protein [Leptolyngbya sp. SIO3F4]